MSPRTRRPHAWLNPAIAAGALAPLALLAGRAAAGSLGPTPVSEAMGTLGRMALVLLVAALACTPLRLLTPWTWPARVRRTLGVLAFAYAAVHVGVYAGLHHGLRVSAILADAAERRFVFAGFGAFVLLAPLALTSTDAAVRRLGYERWSRLHTLVYPAAILAVAHFTWRVEVDRSEPLTYAALVAALLLFRLAAAARRRRS
jgi:sulfoxide reductase heme-binding subunit YedZ